MATRGAADRVARAMREHDVWVAVPTERLYDREYVLVHLDGTSLPDNVYEECAVMTLSDQLGEAIEQRGFGEYDGDEHGPTETTVFMYGPDAERLYSGIEPVLRAYPLCQNARVIIRRSARS